MCLGVPGQLTKWIDHDPVFGRAEIAFDGIRRVCHMACVPDAEVGEFVVVHAGIAISRIDAIEAQRVLDELRQLESVESLTDTIREGEAPSEPLPPRTSFGTHGSAGASPSHNKPAAEPSP